MANVTPENTFNFNKQDYEFKVRIYNGVHDVILNAAAWEDLYIEEDIFDWNMKGSIIIKTDYESFERASDEAETLTNTIKSNLVYKFRNDCRDTLFLTIKPINSSIVQNLQNRGNYEFSDKIWRIELEAVIYDVEELENDGVNIKRKKLYFWDKTYQMMLEKDSEYSTANSGSNANQRSTQTGNTERSLTSVESLGALLTSDEDFNVHAKLVNTSEWEVGDDRTKIFFSSPVGSKFIDNLNYLYNYTVSSSTDNYQPCILKLERADQTLAPKQFSLKSIKKYFQKAGNTINTPGEYQNEHFFIYNSSNDKKPINIRKSPLDTTNIDVNKEMKRDNANTIRGYKLVDLSGIDYAMHLANYKVVSYNSTTGQYNEEGSVHKAEEYKKFFLESIKPNVVTRNSSDRLILTPFIKEGKNTKTIFSLLEDEVSRLADGRNRLLKYYLFSNLAITFDIEGSSNRQPGRFFAVSKQSENAEEFDHKLEGQYFLTNVVHHFRNSTNSYMNRIIGVKTHTYEENTLFGSGNASIINPELAKESAEPSNEQTETTDNQPSEETGEAEKVDRSYTNTDSTGNPTKSTTNPNPTNKNTRKSWKPSDDVYNALPTDDPEGDISSDLFPIDGSGRETNTNDLLPPSNNEEIGRIYGGESPAQNREYLPMPSGPAGYDSSLLDIMQNPPPSSNELPPPSNSENAEPIFTQPLT
jgi:hypothetical protein